MYTSEMVTQVRRILAKDKDVLRLLDAYSAGCETKDEVLAARQDARLSKTSAKRPRLRSVVQQR